MILVNQVNSLFELNPQRMRNISGMITLDGVKTKISIRKIARERRFVIKLDDIETQYGISDETNELINFEGPEIDEFYLGHVKKLINQYFAHCRAIVKLGADDYKDYDDY